ncbi:MAG: hypothetical protein RLZZ09_3019 [Pseudomonadota bacterium]|jgi:hypothetical protein
MHGGIRHDIDVGSPSKRISIGRLNEVRLIQGRVIHPENHRSLDMTGLPR